MLVQSYDKSLKVNNFRFPKIFASIAGGVIVCLGQIVYIESIGPCTKRRWASPSLVGAFGSGGESPYLDLDLFSRTLRLIASVA